MKRAAFLRIHWIVAALPTAIAVVYLSLVWLPGYSAITALQDQIEYERQFVAQAADLPAMLAGCQRDLETAESVVARWEKDAPRSGRLAPHFEKIDAVAREAGLAVTRFAPQPVVVHEKIHEIPLVIDCSGRFAQVHEFLRNIERLPATVWIESIKIENPDDKAKNVKCKITLVAFSAAGTAPASSGKVASSAAVKGGPSVRPSWQQIVRSMQNDPRTTVGLPLSKTRDPFQSPQSVASQR
jgi:Tfp pilus assembly protein PilO